MARRSKAKYILLVMCLEELLVFLLVYTHIHVYVNTIHTCYLVALSVDSLREGCVPMDGGLRCICTFLPFVVLYPNYLC